MQEALERFMLGRTTVVIAHRLSTIRDANRVLVLEHGQIVEEGSHAELMARGGRYQELYLRQFEEPATPAQGEDVMQTTKPKRPTMQLLLSFLGPLRGAYLGTMLGTALVRAAERMFIAYVIKLFVDSITATNLGALWTSVEVWALFLAIWIPANVLLTYLWRATTMRVVTNLRQRIFCHLQRLPLGFHEGRHSGDLVSVMTNDVSAVEQTFQEDLLTLVNASLQGVLAAVFMAFLDWKLALVVVITGLLPVGINTLFAGPLRKAGDAVQKHLGETSERLADLLAGYTVVRTYNLGGWIQGRFQHANQELLDFQPGARAVEFEFKRGQ